MARPALDLAARTYKPHELADYPSVGMKQSSFHYAALEDWFLTEHVRCRYSAFRFSKQAAR